MTDSIHEFTLPLPYPTDRKGPVRWIVSHAVRKWPYVIVLFVGAVGNAWLLGIIMTLIGKAFNAVLAKPADLNTVLECALLIGLIAVARGILQFGRGFGAELLAQGIERDVRNELYISLLGKNMTFHSLQPVGDVMARATNDVREVNFMFSPGVNLVVGSLIFLFLPIFLSPPYHPTLVLTPLLFLGGYIWALRNYLKSLSPLTDQVRGAFGRLNSRLAEALEGIETVKGASQEQSEANRFESNARNYRDAAVVQGDTEARFLPMLLLAVALASGLLHAIFLYNQGLLTIGDVVAYFGLLMMLDFPTFTSLWAYSQISLGLAGARRILALINKENKLDQNIDGYAQPMRGEVEFREVDFSYEDEGDCMLEKISFKVHAGQTVAIVGQTGAGKTSLVKLVNRTYDTNGGSVLVDGIDVRDWNLEALRRGISIIEQDIFLFSRTLADNISFGKPGTSQAEIVKAAESAQADEFIHTFQDGYQTVVGERGVTLSGGQRQRIALARAFLTDPRILILDDSTSAIDSATEDKIQRAIFAATRGRTTFIITHRLSQIRWADLIIVMRKGKIAAVGTHEKLLKTSDAYRRIFSE
jgi:ATP-binding cassette, subfamily B, bacterial